MCIICTKKINDKNLYTLTELNVSCCSNLTSEKLQKILIQCKNLKELGCNSCTSLTSLDLRSNIKLTRLWCNNCTSLTSLDLHSVNLTILWCYNCRSLTNLDLRKNKYLTTLWCYNCTSLTSLDLPKGYHGYIDCSDCPWITQNKEFSSNLQRLIIIQKWYRKLLIIKYMKSQEFIEWIYSPNNIGGRLYKKWLLKNLK